MALNGSLDKDEISPAEAEPEVATEGDVLPPDPPEPSLSTQLLKCVVYMSAHFRAPISFEKLKYESELSSEKCDLHFIAEVIEEHGFNSKAASPDQLDSVLKNAPAIVVLKETAAILVGEAEGKIKLFYPDTKLVDEIPKAEFGFTGALLMKPKLKLDLRSKVLDFPKTYAWFWEPLSGNWKNYLLVLLATVMINVFVIATPIFVMIVYDRVVPNSAVDTLWVLAWGVLFVGIFDFIIKNLRAYFIDHSGKRADFLLSTKLFQQVLNLQMSVKPKSSGALANSLREFESIRDFFTSATLATVGDVPFIFLFILVMWLVGGGLAIITLVAVPIVLAFGFMIQIPMLKLMRESFQENTQKNAHLFEVLSNVETIKGAAAENWALSYWESYVGKNILTTVKTRAYSALLLNFAQFILLFTTVATIVYGVYEIKEGNITLGTLIACMILNSRAMAPLLQVCQLFARYQQAMNSLKALHMIMMLPVERPEDKQFLHREHFKGAVEFKDVNFTYPGESFPALKNVSFNVNRGEHVGIIGRIGSGKSTLLKLVANLYPPEQGSCLIDGIDARQIDPLDLRKNIGYVLQDSALFFGSIRDNIVMGEDVTDEQILKASSVSVLESLLQQHPAGYDCQVGERGELISGGQRQAIVIARALLRDPPILLFDEPTSHMDHSTEKQFIINLQSILKNKTLLLVTHRTTLLALVDRLIVVDKGQIVADGLKEPVLNALSEKPKARE